MATFSTSVSATADDCMEFVGALFDDAESIFGLLAVGRSIDPLDVHSGLRFLNVTIPQGATINTATVTVYNQVTQDDSLTLSARWYAWAADDAGQFTSGGNLPSTVSKTTAFTAFTQGTATPANIAHNVASILQEIVNRGGWVSGNDVNFIAFENGSPDGCIDAYEGFDSAGGTPALLQVDYTAGGGTSKAVFAHHLKTQGIS
jgi:hypothetical protein